MYRDYKYLLGGFEHVFIFTLICGEMIQFDLHIFYTWVETQPPTILMETDLC